MKFAFSALESRFAPIVEHIKRKPKTSRFKLVVYKHDLSKYFEGGGHPGSDDAHPKTHSQSKKRVCAAGCVYNIFAVRKREREREREEKICSISQEPSYSTENKIKKSVEVQINGEEVGGGWN